MNGIVFLTSFLVCSLLLYKNIIEFVYLSCILKFCWTCLFVLIFFVEILRIFLYIKLCDLQVEIVLLCFQLDAFYLLTWSPWLDLQCPGSLWANSEVEDHVLWFSNFWSSPIWLVIPPTHSLFPLLLCPPTLFLANQIPMQTCLPIWYLHIKQEKVAFPPGRGSPAGDLIW